MPGARLDSPQTVAARLLLTLTKEVAAAVLTEDGFGSHADEVMLCSAVWIGHAEDRPMTAAKIAEYIGMPRATVVRKLEQLKARGILHTVAKGRWCIANNEIKRARFALLSAANKQHIHRAASKLSILDS